MQLASHDASSSDVVRMGISFVSKNGEYCRTFTSGQDGTAFGGLACRSGGAWRISALQSIADDAVQSGQYRQAASSIPTAIMETAQGMMVGDALDAAAEARARDEKWMKPRDVH
jgi:Arc/MetJ-type ribon-helix-helix transcriptional regulator